MHIPSTRKMVGILFICGVFSACDGPQSTELIAVSEPVDEFAIESFMMRNEEIREDVLVQFEIHDIEHWINADTSISFYAGDAEEVDRIVNESISVWVTLQ